MIDKNCNDCAPDIIAILNGCKEGCNCKFVNYDCVPSCTFTELPFKYPCGYSRENFSNIFIVFADNNQADTRPLLFSDSTTCPQNFNLDNNLIILNDIDNPCEFCVPAGTYAYEITGTLETDIDPDRQKLLLIQQGKICVTQSIRSVIVPCP